jgi:tetratricopeptide (TPR) repeat protein
VKAEDKQIIKKMFGEIDHYLDEKSILQWSYLSEGSRKTPQPDWEHIREIYQNIIALDPNNIEALTGMGHLLSSYTREYDEIADALPYYRRVVKLEPNDFQHQYNLAIALSGNNRPRKEIKKHLFAAIDARPDWFADYDDLEIDTDFIDEYTTFEKIHLNFAKTTTPWFLFAAVAGAGLNQYFASHIMKVETRKEKINKS